MEEGISTGNFLTFCFSVSFFLCGVCKPGGLGFFWFRRAPVSQIFSLFPLALLCQECARPISPQEERNWKIRHDPGYHAVFPPLSSTVNLAARTSCRTLCTQVIGRGSRSRAPTRMTEGRAKVTALPVSMRAGNGALPIRTQWVGRKGNSLFAHFQPRGLRRSLDGKARVLWA